MSNTVADKKQEERGYLNSLRYVCDDFPDGEIIPDESPDFIIKLQNCRLGVEITKLYLEHGRKRRSPQSIESARNRITRLAKELAEKIGLPPISVTLFFNHTKTLLRSRESAIAKAVVEAVREDLPPPGENADLECRHGSAQPTEVDGILTNRAYPVEEHEWKWMEASRIVRNGIEHIERAIFQKASCLEAIREKCDECWLLIVAETSRASGNIKPDDESFAHLYHSPFERTYFFDNGLGRLTQLKTFGHPATGAACAPVLRAADGR
jgi:hypothetical protein